MPTYNRRDIVLQTLHSLERQSLEAGRFEVIVGVDGSTDGTVEALEAYHPPYPFRWFFQRNAGAIAAVTAAARLARNEVLIITGDDQVCDPGMVAAHLETHQRMGNVLVQGDYPLAPGHDRTGASLAYERARRGALERGLAHGTASFHMWGGNFSLRRSAFDAIGGGDMKFSDYGAEDTDIGLRVAALGVPIVIERRALSHHLHVVDRRRFGRQSFSEGRSAARLARKHALDLNTFPGGSMRSPFDRVVARGWLWSTAAMERGGRVLTLLLGAADATRIRPLQTAAARLVRRFYRVGGMATELRAAHHPQT